ncbi:MAG: amino acid permease [Steroidobacteraceae bacterium]|jgi:APA family basic amino acid/polyamine antiporter|nr:amino acid permease [Steroidobacteraceae bacterium]
MDWRIKPLDEILANAERKALRRSLGPFQLMMLGIGAIIGTGIFVLTAVGAERAGPALMLSFVIAGTVCAFAALSYAELSSMVPVAGSAYTYSYGVMGELVAWVVGWNLILEYAVAASAVAVGWSGYMNGLLQSWGAGIPETFTAGYFDLKGGQFGAGQGVVNLLAVSVVVVVCALLVRGTRESAAVNTALVFVKLLALGVFVVIAIPNIDWDNFSPFMPFGFLSHEVYDPQLDAEVAKGVMAAAALIFFAYVGFDAVSTAAEETKNPNRNVPIGLIGSLALCTVVYLLVAAGAVGTMPTEELKNSKEPLAEVLRNLGFQRIGDLIGVAAVLALPTVVMMMIFGQVRIFFAMSRDHLLPPALSAVHPRFGTPWIMTVVTGVLVMAIAGFFSVDEIAELSNTGTLLAFIAVSAGVLVLRRTQPDRPRPFRCPAVWVIAPLAIGGCLFLLASVPPKSLLRFGVWNVVGIAVYLLYSRGRSMLAVRAA